MQETDGPHGRRLQASSYMPLRIKPIYVNVGQDSAMTSESARWGRVDVEGNGAGAEETAWRRGGRAAE